MVRLVRRAALVLVAALLPSMALAQASITGVVRDASGGVLPGVTVEAASPALIEKVRSAVTDGTVHRDGRCNLASCIVADRCASSSVLSAARVSKATTFRAFR